MIIFFWMNAQSILFSAALDRGLDDHLFWDECLIIFFSAAYTKKHVICGGREGGGGSKWRSSPRVPGYKKPQNRLYVALHAVSHSMPQRLQNVIKKQRRNAGY